MKPNRKFNPLSVSVTILSFIFLYFCLRIGIAAGEGTTFYVTANRLNGRAAPRKTGFIESIFDNGDTLTSTGKWSKDHKWVEVEGGESGTVWVDIRYISERKTSFTAETLNPKKVKIRKKPNDGKVVGYLHKGQKIEIYQVVLGWGRCKKGWIDLDYLIELVGDWE